MVLRADRPGRYHVGMSGGAWDQHGEDGYGSWRPAVPRSAGVGAVAMMLAAACLLMIAATLTVTAFGGVLLIAVRPSEATFGLSLWCGAAILSLALYVPLSPWRNIGLLCLFLILPAFILLMTEAPALLGAMLIMTAILHASIFGAIWLSRLAMGLGSDAAWRARRLARGKCPSCGYSIHGLTEDRCPECGERWTLGEIHAAVHERLR